MTRTGPFVDASHRHLRSERLDKVSTCAGNSRPDRTDGTVTYLGRLFIGQPEHLREQKGGSPFGAELIKDEPDLDGGGRLIDGTHTQQTADEASASVASTPLVDTGPAGDAEQPRSGAALCPKAGERLPRPEVDLLGEIVSAGPVDHVGTEPPHVRLAATDDGHEGCVVAVPGVQQQPRELVHGLSLARAVTRIWHGVGNSAGLSDDYKGLDAKVTIGPTSAG